MARARPLERIAADAMPVAMGGLAAILVCFAAADLLLYERGVRGILFAADGGLGLLLGATAWACHRRPPPASWAHPIMAGAVALTVLNVLLGIALGTEPAHSTYLVLVVVGAGSVFLSWRWTLAVCSFTGAAWGLTVAAEPWTWDRTQFALGFFGACAVALLIVGVRMRMYGNLERLRGEERALRQEHQVALATLRESAERLQAVVTGAPIVLFALDPDGRFRFATGKGLEAAGVEPHELIGRTIHDVYPAATDLASHFERALAGETSTGQIHAGDHAFLVSWGPMRGPDGNVKGIVGVATNVTDQVRAERELEASRRHIQRQERLAALGTLVAGVAHEINNPLAFMKGNAQLTEALLGDALAREGVPEALRADLGEALRLQVANLDGMDRLSRISESLRAVAKSERGVHSPQDLAAIVETTLTVAAPRLREGLRVETDLQATGAPLGDEAELCQVALNLVLNAADELAGRPDGRIVVRTLDTPDAIALEVEDNGRGIPPAQQELIFAPFYTTKTSGTGLGLSISHRIVDDHGGILSFTTEPGRTVFRMELPRAAPGAAPSVAPAAREAATPGHVRRVKR